VLEVPAPQRQPNKQGATKMKKNEVKKNAAKTEEKEVKEKVKRVIPKEQKQLNEMMKSVRKVGYKFIKSIKQSSMKDDYLARLSEAFKEVSDKIASMQSEVAIEMKFSSMSDAEREYLKKMLNN
jgi:hypothetical protein